MNLIDLSGKRFNNLLVIKRAEVNKSHPHWICLCDCGETIIVKGGLLTRKEKPQQSCKKCFLKRNSLHGMTNTKEFFAWRGILSRCDDINSKSYKDYGGRGIKYCDKWGEFKNFFEDMGYAPTKKHTIDREDNNGDYEPNNCRWVVMKSQQRNKRNNRMLEFNGEVKCISEWSEKTGLGHNCIWYRIKRGMSVEEALTKPSLKEK